MSPARGGAWSTAGVGRLVGGWLAVSWGAALGFGLATRTPDLSSADDPADPAPDLLVSVIVPMRNEARNAGASVASVLAQDHRALELVVVDDGSDDGTAERARSAAGGDPRLRIVHGAPVPPGWVGKPWACHQGARAAAGRWLVFVDADVRLHPAALRTLLADATAHDAQVASWVGRLELSSFWERTVNPVVFCFISATSPLPLARRPHSRVVLVNGQFLAFDRRAYRALAGHAGVRDAVVEDLALGRRAKARYGDGYRFAWADDLLSTRMYRSLAEIGEGWSKNMAVGASVVGIHPGLMVLGAALGGAGPWLGLLASLTGRRSVHRSLFAVAAAAQVGTLGLLVRRLSRLSPAWGLGAPLGTTAVVAIAVRSWWSTARGAIRWRGRVYAARR